jgi:hypothetical protein
MTSHSCFVAPQGGKICSGVSKRPRRSLLLL